MASVGVRVILMVAARFRAGSDARFSESVTVRVSVTVVVTVTVSASASGSVFESGPESVSFSMGLVTYLKSSTLSFSCS